MTKTQANILAFTRKFISDHGYSPSIVEIAQGVGSYSATVRNALSRLHERGYLLKGRGWRSVRLPDEGANARAA